jgi:16S rRNA (guanine527-N7)-methyltransferase
VAFSQVSWQHDPRPTSPLGRITEQDAQLAALARLIAESPHNLVSRADRDRIAAHHIPESMAVLEQLSVRPGQRWMDLGTGGGLPGLVLAVCRPDVHWTLMDATRKKVAAVAHFADSLGLSNVATATGRAEVLARDAAYRGAFDGVVARALAPLPVLVELARGFLRDDGILAAVKGPSWQDELAAARPALAPLSLEYLGATHVDSTARPTWVVRMRAVGPPPESWPRGDGVPRREPLGT